MPERYVRANGIELAYDEFGDLNNPVILLIMGLGTQITTWRDANSCPAYVAQTVEFRSPGVTGIRHAHVAFDR
jgi:pimeloyl-ACP methyl ester carboxylesterase